MKVSLTQELAREMRIRNYSECSIRSYTSCIDRAARYHKVEPLALTRDQIRRYALHLIQERQISPSTLNQLISAWKLIQVDILKVRWRDSRWFFPDRKLWIWWVPCPISSTGLSSRSYTAPDCA